MLLPRDAASAAYAVVVCLHCPSVCPSVCLHKSVSTETTNVGSRKQCHIPDRDCSFFDAKDLGEIRKGLPPTYKPNADRIG